MREALAFNKSQKMSSILLIILTCASLFLRQETTSGSTYLLAIFGWPFIIFCLNLMQTRKVTYVAAEPPPVADSADADSK